MTLIFQDGHGAHLFGGATGPIDRSCIPLLAIAAIFTGLAGVIAVCVALVGVTVITAHG